MAYALVMVMLVTLLTASVAKVRYDNYKVYHVVPTDQHHLTVLRDIETRIQDLSLWSDVQDVNNPVHIMVPPYQEEEFTNLIKSFSMLHKINMHNVQELIDLQEPVLRSETSFGFEEYHSLDEIYDWLTDLSTLYPGVVTLSDVGETYEGRFIRAVKISHKTGNRGVFIETGIHACEWIGPATVLYILNELLTSNNTEIRDIAENFDWYIDRLWRKTRSEYNATCYGVDPNRNWDFHWGEVGTSPDPCNRMYAGPGPLSEVEIRGLSQYITSVAERLDIYISFHSYGQLLMFPYGFTEDPVDNYDTLSNIAEKAANSLTSVHGTVYKSGPIISTVFGPPRVYYAPDILPHWLSHRTLDIIVPRSVKDPSGAGIPLPTTWRGALPEI
uniref:Zinc carboxypeptidase A 1 n=1 Tax=Timema poppense TaxID=170557 RepID=A0A7R9GYC1_TIMPO|nr:unnamed protein product [Timema poppensis]